MDKIQSDELRVYLRFIMRKKGNREQFEKFRHDNNTLELHQQMKQFYNERQVKANALY